MTRNLIINKSLNIALHQNSFDNRMKDFVSGIILIFTLQNAVSFTIDSKLKCTGNSTRVQTNFVYRKPSMEQKTSLCKLEVHVSSLKAQRSF